MIYILVGNSGCGKTTIKDRLYKYGINKIVTYTTRDKRQGEVNGEDYNFIDIETFLKMDRENKFIGTTEYIGNFYATLKEDLEKNKSKGQDCVIVVDENGVYPIKEEFKDAIAIYLSANRDVIKDRMNKRGDNYLDVSKRLESFYDFRNISDYIVDASRDIDEVYLDVLKIIRKESK